MLMKVKVVFFYLSITAIVFSQNQIVLDRAVRVNNTIIRESDIQNVFNNFNRMDAFMVGLGTVSNRQMTIKDVANLLVNLELIKQSLRSNTTITVTNAEVEDAINLTREAYKQSQANINPRFVYNENEFRQYINRQFNKRYELYVEELRDNLRIQKYISSLIDEERNRIISTGISENELFAYYNSNINSFIDPPYIEVKHIFIPTIRQDSAGNAVPLEQSARNTARRRLEDALGRLRNGESFNEICLLYSGDSSKNAGSLNVRLPEVIDAVTFEQTILPAISQGADLDFIRGSYRLDSQQGYVLTRESLYHARVQSVLSRAGYIFDRGYLGLFYRDDNEMANIFKSGEYARLFTLNKGDISPIIESNAGYHIFCLIDKEEQPSNSSFVRVRGEIWRMLITDRIKVIYNRKFEELSAQLRQTATITYYKEEYRN